MEEMVLNPEIILKENEPNKGLARQMKNILKMIRQEII
ncbi:MAG: hypothetical protein ACI9DJ_000015 [Algoriphagus sp.]|jgi:hypothetical protein